MLNINELKYSVFHPQNPFNKYSVNISDSTYTFWMDFWNTFYAKNNLKHQADKITFLKQSAISALTYKGEVVGAQLHTFFNLKSKVCKDNPYLLNLKEENFTKFANLKLSTALTMEHLSVDPEYRSKKTNMNFGDILIGLALKLMSELDLDCAFGIARSDIRVNEMSKRFGGVMFEDNIQMFGFPCCFAVMTKKNLKDHPNERTQSLINYLWRTKDSFLNHALKPKLEFTKVKSA